MTSDFHLPSLGAMEAVNAIAHFAQRPFGPLVRHTLRSEPVVLSVDIKMPSADLRSGTSEAREAVEQFATRSRAAGVAVLTLIEHLGLTRLVDFHSAPREILDICQPSTYPHANVSVRFVRTYDANRGAFLSRLEVWGYAEPS